MWEMEQNLEEGIALIVVSSHCDLPTKCSFRTCFFNEQNYYTVHIIAFSSIGF